MTISTTKSDPLEEAVIQQIKEHVIDFSVLIFRAAEAEGELTDEFRSDLDNRIKYNSRLRSSPARFVRSFNQPYVDYKPLRLDPFSYVTKDRLIANARNAYTSLCNTSKIDKDKRFVVSTNCPDCGATPCEC